MGLPIRIILARVVRVFLFVLVMMLCLRMLLGLLVETFGLESALCVHVLDSCVFVLFHI